MTKPFDTAAFDKIRDIGQGGTDLMLKNVGAVSKTAQTMGIEWADFAKQTMSHSTATMQALFKAPSPQAALEIQTEYLKGSYERAMAQAKVMTELYQGLAKDLVKPIEAKLGTSMPMAA